jgi:hypothetical protein
MSLPASVKISGDVMSRQVADETVLLDLASGHYYGLDPVGTRIWHLLADGKTPQETRDALVSEYEVAPEQLEADIEKLIVDLKAHGLLTAS